VKNLITVALTVVTILMLGLFIAGCSDGDNGVDGITGTGGCDFDQVRDEETGLCVHAVATHDTNHPSDGDPGAAGNDGAAGSDGADGQDGADADDASIQAYVMANCTVDLTTGALTCT